MNFNSGFLVNSFIHNVPLTLAIYHECDPNNQLSEIKQHMLFKTF